MKRSVLLIDEELEQPIILASWKLQPCLLNQPLKTWKKLKELKIKNYVLKCNLYIF